VLTDDDDSELDEAWRDGDLWSGERHVPTSSPGSCRTLAELLVRAPARPWRELPPDASAAPGCHADRRRTLRHEFERAIVEQLAAHRVDLVLCDSFMSVLGPLALAAYPGRILNVHPGITRPGARAQLLGPTPTRDAYTRAVYGFVITDDKRLVRRPVGPPVRVMYDGVPRDAVAVAPVAETGVTVHVVTERVDEGPIVLEQSYAFDPRAISPEAIRARNYELKRDLVPRALLKHLDELSA
jgi:folate-dependent phosphoribosylglycinamide formyltransferase PurN